MGVKYSLAKNMVFCTIHPKRQNKSERIMGGWWRHLLCRMKNLVEDARVVSILHLELLNTTGRVVKRWGWPCVCSVKTSVAKTRVS